MPRNTTTTAMHGGGTATTNGEAGEQLLRGLLLGMTSGNEMKGSTYAKKPHNHPCKKEPLLVSQFPYVNAYGINSRMDYVVQLPVFIKGLHPDDDGILRVYIEVKQQSTGGTTDEKLPFVLDSFRNDAQMRNCILVLPGLWWSGKYKMKKNKNTKLREKVLKTKADMRRMHGIHKWIASQTLPGKFLAIMLAEQAPRKLREIFGCN